MIKFKNQPKVLTEATTTRVVQKKLEKLKEVYEGQHKQRTLTSFTNSWIPTRSVFSRKKRDKIQTERPVAFVS